MNNIFQNIFMFLNTQNVNEEAIKITEISLKTYQIIIIVVVFVILAIIFLYFFKSILMNSIFGVFGFLICNFIFGMNLPFLPTIIVSAIFGFAGLAVMIILKLFGVF